MTYFLSNFRLQKLLKIMNNKFVTRIIILLLFISPKIFSQDLNESKSIYKWFDSIVGVGNTGIYNGVEYLNEYKTLNGNDEFFITSDFLYGDVVYDQQPYFNIQMKYDVYKDELIVLLPGQNSRNIIKLIKTKIKSFSIQSSSFVGAFKNLSKSRLEFFEVIYEKGELKVFKKHRKERKVKLDKDFIYNKFEDKFDYYLVYDGDFYSVGSKRDIGRLFPKFKKDILSYASSIRRLYKVDYELYLIRLSEFINNKISINNKNI